MAELNEEINGVIMIHKDRAIGALIDNPGIWTAHYTFRAENKTTMLMRDFFGEGNQLQCIIDTTDKEITITIPKP